MDKISVCNNGAGGILKMEMEEKGWSQNDLAEITGLTTKTISLIVNNKQTMTPVNALLLGMAFNNEPEFWMNLDARYQLEKVKNGDKEKSAEIALFKAKIHKIMPFTEIKKKGWLKADMTSVKSMKEEILKILGKEEIPEKIDSEELKACARRTQKDTEYTERNCNAWYTFAKFFSSNFILPDYDKNRFLEIAWHIPSYTNKENGVETFIEDLNSCGVGFFTLAHLEKTYLDGAAFINNKNPFIVYTGRYDRIDNFWFVMAHECAHILNDYDFLKSAPCIDDCDLTSEQSESREVKADETANLILGKQKVSEMGKIYNKYMTLERLQQISEAAGVSLQVTLGMLQHDKIIEWRKFSNLRKTVREKIPSNYVIGEF